MYQFSRYNNLGQDLDSKFSTYEKYIRDMVPHQLAAFMSWLGNGPGNKYFTCTYEVSGRTTSVGTCPNRNVNYSSMQDAHIYYKLNDEAGFFAELEKTYGIAKDWIKFDTLKDTTYCQQPQGFDISCRGYTRFKHSFPVSADNIVVPNPRNLIRDGLPGFETLQDTLEDIYDDLVYSRWDGPTEEISEVMVVPVSMAATAADSMEQIRSIADQVQAEEQKQLVLEVLSVVFMFVPFVGGALVGSATAVVANLGRILSLVGLAGNGALAVYDIIENPSSLFLQMLGMLMGGVGGSLGRNAKDIKVLSGHKAGMKGNLDKLGPKFVMNDKLVTDIVRYCKKK